MVRLAPVDTSSERERTAQARVSRFQASNEQRLYWRVFVHTEGTIDGSRSTRAPSWHLVACSDPKNPDAHCEQGRAFLQINGDPEGHCVADGECRRCAMLGAKREAANAPDHRTGPAPIAEAVGNATVTVDVVPATS